MHLSRAIWEGLFARTVCTASLISPSVAIPVEIMIGLPVREILSMSARSTNSNEATLYAGTPIDSRKSTDVSSKGVEKKAKPRSSATCLSLGCHSHGV